MYKLFKINDEVIGACKTEGKFKICFNFTDPANSDYQEFLRWCEAGNEPLPADSQE